MSLGAAIGGGLGLVGSVLSSSSNRSAAREVGEISQQNNAENIAFATRVDNRNQQTLSPFVNRGNAAGSAINDLLGIGGSQPQAQPNALTQFRGPTPFGGAGAPYGLSDTSFLGRQDFGSIGGERGFGGNVFNSTTGLSSPFNGLTGAGTPAFLTSGLRGLPRVQPTSEAQISNGGQAAQNAAFENFRNSTGYQFRLNEGLDALNSGWAGAGLIQSGAAARDAIEYGQNFASNEFGNYLNALGAQQAVGAGAASSLAGVGQNFSSQVINSNNQNASNQANALLVRGNNNPFANAAGILGGAAFSGAFG